MLPTARRFDRRAPPDASGSVEIEKPAGEMPAAVLDHEVSIENDRLHLRQKRVLAIDVSPAHLHHADFRIAEVVHDIVEEIRRRYKVGIKDRNQFAGRQLAVPLPMNRLTFWLTVSEKNSLGVKAR